MHVPSQHGLRGRKAGSSRQGARGQQQSVGIRLRRLQAAGAQAGRARSAGTPWIPLTLPALQLACRLVEPGPHAELPLLLPVPIGDDVVVAHHLVAGDLHKTSQEQAVRPTATRLRAASSNLLLLPSPCCACCLPNTAPDLGFGQPQKRTLHRATIGQDKETSQNPGPKTRACKLGVRFGPSAAQNGFYLRP